MPNIPSKPDKRAKSATTANPRMPAKPKSPDYDLDENVVADTAAQMKALGDPTRRAILDLVLERAATTTELAAALGRPKGTVDHHLKVLANAGMIRVVKTRKVRAMTERSWGRVARTIWFKPPGQGDVASCAMFVREALEEITATTPRHDDVPSFSSLRHARISTDRAAEFEGRLEELALEFASTERGGSTVFALLLSLYPTDQPILPDATS